MPIYPGATNLVEGGTEVYLVTLIDGTKAVFKPDDIRYSRSSYRKEIAAYHLSEALNLHFVPPTVERELFGRKGSMQLYIDNAITFDWSPRNRDDPAIQLIRVFDYLLSNIDRYGTNYLHANGRYYAIDNGGAYETLLDPREEIFTLPFDHYSLELDTLFRRIRESDLDENHFAEFMDLLDPIERDHFQYNFSLLNHVLNSTDD